MTIGDNGAEPDIELQRAFLAEVFHNLSQPLTALHCSLDLALNRDRSVEALRDSIQTALENAECLRQRLLLVRALADATDPGDLSQPTDLAGMFRELRDDMLPLFESAGKRLELEIDCDSFPVRGNQTRLMRAMFFFLEYLFRYSPDGAVFTIRVRARGERQPDIRIAAPGSLPIASAANSAVDTAYACEIEMVRRSFRAAGGDFIRLPATVDQSIWQATCAAWNEDSR